MSASSQAPLGINFNDFIRVREDHVDHTRAGKDGLVVDVDEDGVALVFGFDRDGVFQNVRCVGAEFWRTEELDPKTLDRYRAAAWV